MTKKPTDTNAYLISDFVDIQRKSFFELLEKGLIEEFSKRNPISNQNLEVFFYPEYYQLTPPELNPRRAILLSKSYSSKLFIPVQFTDKNWKKTQLKWILIGNLPLMTKRGHFVLNGAPRVIVNQILRSPGIYFQGSLKEILSEKWSEKAEMTYKRYYTELICLRGTWLRIEIDQNKDIWAQMKKIPKIPILWFLLAMGLTERVIFKSVSNPTRLLANFNPDIKRKIDYEYITNPPDAWKQISYLINSSSKPKNLLLPKNYNGGPQQLFLWKGVAAQGKEEAEQLNSPLVSDSLFLKKRDEEQSPPPFSEALSKPYKKKKFKMGGSSYFGDSEATTSKGRMLSSSLSPEVRERKQPKNSLIVSSAQTTTTQTPSPPNPIIVASQGKGSLPMCLTHAKEGRNWIFKRFMNPRAYDLGIQGRLNFNKKLGLSISSNQTTLTAQDVLYATDYLLKVEKGLKNIDDIDHLKNRRVRTSGELLQIQIGIGLVRLEKMIRDKLSIWRSQLYKHSLLRTPSPRFAMEYEAGSEKIKNQKSNGSFLLRKAPILFKSEDFKLNNLINTKAFNGALREFFGTSQLSQFMDQLNPLAEITHKRRLSSMGPGGVTRDSATLAIRGIHPTHYGRICPIETPEGKNTGLVNSLTTYARVNSRGFLESPFLKVFKGQIQKNAGIFFLSAEQEEKLKVAAADLFISSIGFLPKYKIPAKVTSGTGASISQITRNSVEYIGISPIQMISIATSLIPFLEHDDANRALMGSNMQRQAVPLIRAERPLVGTGLESRAVSDSSHAIIAKYSGYVSYVSAKKIIILTLSA